VQAVVRDVRGLGVMFAPQLRTFTCLTGAKEAIQQRASLPELTALVQVSLEAARLRSAAHSHLKLPSVILFSLAAFLCH
jgi:hypothetical protein